uniref:Uncharacterized protein n=1 Tax=Anopheles maculatus TaxID=74869 RepID=A0A182SBF8_9DIPT
MGNINLCTKLASSPAKTAHQEEGPQKTVSFSGVSVLGRLCCHGGNRPILPVESERTIPKANLPGSGSAKKRSDDIFHHRFFFLSLSHQSRFAIFFSTSGLCMLFAVLHFLFIIAAWRWRSGKTSERKIKICFRK